MSAFRDYRNGIPQRLTYKEGIDERLFTITMYEGHDPLFTIRDWEYFGRPISMQRATELFLNILNLLGNKERKQWFEGITTLGNPLSQRILKKALE